MTVSTIPYHENPRVRSLPLSQRHRFQYNVLGFPAFPTPVVTASVHQVAPQADQSSDSTFSTDASVGDILETAAGDVIETPVVDVTEDISDPEPPPSFPQFMQMPGELRDMVWDGAIRGVDHATIKFRDKFAKYLVTLVEIRNFLQGGVENNLERPNFLPPLCRLSKSTVDETIGVYLRGSTLIMATIHDIELLDGILKIVPGSCGKIRLIHFTFFDCFPGPNKYP